MRYAKTMELNEKENIWDGYHERIIHDFIQPKDEDFAKLSPNDQKAIFSEIKASAWMVMGTWDLSEACLYRIHPEMQNPAYDDILKKIVDKCYQIVGYCWSPIYAVDNMDLLKNRQAVGMIFLALIERFMKFDAELLDLIKQAIEIMDKKQGG